MAYNTNGYFPVSYQPYSQYQVQPQYPQASQPNNALTWIQGEAAAKSFPVAAGGSVLLLDSEQSCFYIKTVDASGMPLPLRIFDYTERISDTNEPNKDLKPTESEFVTRKELEDRLMQFMKEQEKTNG